MCVQLSRMKAFDLSKLNTGLSRVVSTKEYPKTRRQYLPRTTKGRVFRLGVLHGKALSEAAMLRNRRGYINSQVNTVALAPSLYHWLFHRCGIPFAESRELVRLGKLKVDDVVVTKERDLESQLDWSTFQQLDIQVRSSLPALVERHQRGMQKGRTGPSRSSEEMDASETMAAVVGPWVPALKRALHRSYSFFYAHPGLSISSEEANPRSFVHRVESSGVCVSPAAPEATLGFNVLRPIGFMDGMRGLALCTNDVAMIRYWNNEFLGNYGCFDVRFPRGVPSQVVHRTADEIRKGLMNGIQQQLSPVVKVPCACVVERVPVPPNKDVVASMMHPKALHDERILVTTPLMPYRQVQRARRVGGLFTLVRSGPFSLPPSLPHEANTFRLLTTGELAILFTFERRLKTNRVLLSLAEFDAAEGELDVALPR